MFTPASMAIPSADVVAAKWARNAGQAQQDYQLGIQNTDVDPTALAIAAIPRALQRYTEAVNSGKMANGLRRVGKAGWQQAALSKGAGSMESSRLDIPTVNGARFAPGVLRDASGEPHEEHDREQPDEDAPAVPGVAARSYPEQRHRLPVEEGVDQEERAAHEHELHPARKSTDSIHDDGSFREVVCLRS